MKYEVAKVAALGFAVLASVGQLLSGPAAITAVVRPEKIEHKALAIGVPGPQMQLEQWYVIGYEPRTKTPAWVAEKLTRQSLQGTPERVNAFHRDDRLPDSQASIMADYEGTGYDRGHCAPAGDAPNSAEAMKATFTLANMMPQERHLNRGVWNQLEEHVRKVALRSNVTYVFTGPLWKPEKGRGPELFATVSWVGVSHVAVPTHCWKVAYVEDDNGRWTCSAWILPNRDPPENADIEDYRVTADDVEAWTGLDFGAYLEDPIETAIERVK